MDPSSEIVVASFLDLGPYWVSASIGSLVTLFLLGLFFSSGFRALIFLPFKVLISSVKIFFKFYNFHEFDTSNPGNLPQPPTLKEKYSYISRKNHFMIFCSIISFSAIQFSLYNFLTTNTVMWPLYIYLALTIIYFLDSFFVNVFSKDFDFLHHKYIVNKWRGKHTRSVDVFLPTAGEPIEVLENTWKGIKELESNYTGEMTVYVLDDAHRESVLELSQKFNFVYESRPDKGWFKKAGNLRHGFRVSHGEFIAIFDADFRPRADFLHELLPYFYENSKVGLVQSPQYFDVHDKQNWLQRGAGAVQELFYRMSQVSRQGHNASICVGSNALYRREALKATGGTALIEHSEDVHTGFNIRMHGWTIQYVPILLAKGLCPADMKAFFKQQYRWCLGSMTLLTSLKFWQMRLPFMARLSYFSGFLYYIHTAVSTFFVPIVPLALMLLYPNQLTWGNYFLILPSLIYVQIIYPLWHNATYGLEAWATRSVYGWAHVFAIADKIIGHTMQWQPTGAKLGKDLRYVRFRILQVLFNLLPATLWVYIAGERIFIQNENIYIPLFLTGLYYYVMCAKVTFYKAPTNNLPKTRFYQTMVKLRPVAAFAAITLLLFAGIHYGFTSTKQPYTSPLPSQQVLGDTAQR